MQNWIWVLRKYYTPEIPVVSVCREPWIFV